MSMEETVGDLLRKAELDYTKGTTHISKYVDFSMHDTLERIDAYLNSKHITGETDSLGREKPFFNIVIAAANIWFRATDIDTSNIKIRATKAADWLDSFVATIYLRDWMNKERFAVFLNEWGRTLSRYGGAVVKTVKNSDGLHISVVPWNQIICDPVDFDSNLVAEVIELTEAQLYGRIKTHGYYSDAVDDLCDAISERETLDKQNKDNKTGYIKLYEVHGLFPKSNLTGLESDEDIFVQQMHVISYVGKKNGRKTEYQDFTLYAGEETKSPYRLTYLIKEDGRTLPIGAVESLFESQWMQNHSKKAVKDILDISSKLILQTADSSLAGRNALTDIENGDMILHAPNMPVTKVDNSKPDTASWDEFSNAWKSLGNEITGISEAMLGTSPNSDTTWRQTEALLQESYSLFQLMTENKGLQIIDMMREDILPFLRTQMSHADEISATLADHEVRQIDSIYIKNKAIKIANRKAFVAPMLKGQLPTQEGHAAAVASESANMQQGLNLSGSQRFFVPSELDDKTWQEQFANLENEVDIDVTGESQNVQESMTSLNTTLKLILTPGFDQNPKAQMVAGKLLELSGAMSPIEYNAVQAAPTPPIPQGAPTDTAQPVAAPPGAAPALPVAQ